MTSELGERGDRVRGQKRKYTTRNSGRISRFRGNPVTEVAQKAGGGRLDELKTAG